MEKIARHAAEENKVFFNLIKYFLNNFKRFIQSISRRHSSPNSSKSNYIAFCPIVTISLAMKLKRLHMPRIMAWARIAPLMTLPSTFQKWTRSTRPGPGRLSLHRYFKKLIKYFKKIFKLFFCRKTLANARASTAKIKTCCPLGCRICPGSKWWKSIALNVWKFIIHARRVTTTPMGPILGLVSRLVLFF